MKRFKGFIKPILHSIAAAFVLLFICYLLNNIPYPFGTDTGLYTFKESIVRNSKKRLPNYDNVVFVNTGYDVQLVETDNGMEKITDRNSLLRFLRDVEYSDYKHIFIDIRFEKGLVTATDTVLVAQINRMGDRITVAKHLNYDTGKDYELIDPSLLDKAAYCDYTYSLYNTSFSCYQFNQKKGPSAALDMYNKINKRNIKRYLGFLYMDGWALCQNSLFLSVSDNFSIQESQNHSARYLNLGTDIYDWYTIDLFKEYCNNKIICIGDFAFDLHDTYYGKQPGTYLHWLAYDSLCKKRHTVSFLAFFLLLILYSLLFYCKTIRFDLSHRVKNHFLSFAVSLVSSGLILSVTCFIIYWINGMVISIFLPTIVFAIYDLVIKYLDDDKRK